jgi:HlyD family secretion protein
MTANVTIVYADKKSVVTVPNTALRFRPPPEAGAQPSGDTRRGRDAGAGADDSKTIWTLAGGAPAALAVKVGLSDGAYTEILGNDLKEGDAVVIDATVTGKSSAGSAPTGTVRRPF